MGQPRVWRDLPLCFGSTGSRRAQCPDGLHSLLKAQSVCQAAQAPPVSNCAKLFGSLGTGPTVHPRDTEPQPASPGPLGRLSPCPASVKSQATHVAGDSKSALRPHLIAVPQVLGDIPGHTKMMLHRRPLCSFSPVSTLEPELPTFRGTFSCTRNTTPLLHT